VKLCPTYNFKKDYRECDILNFAYFEAATYKVPSGFPESFHRAYLAASPRYRGKL
jgi:hypothetical protein